MGGAQLVSGLAGDGVEERSGDDIRDAESDEIEHYTEMLKATELVEGVDDALDL